MKFFRNDCLARFPCLYVTEIQYIVIFSYIEKNNGKTSHIENWYTETFNYINIWFLLVLNFRDDNTLSTQSCV